MNHGRRGRLLATLLAASALWIRSRREMVQHRIEKGLPAKIYPKPHFRRGRAKKPEPAGRNPRAVPPPVAIGRSR